MADSAVVELQMRPALFDPAITQLRYPLLETDTDAHKHDAHPQHGYVSSLTATPAM